MEAKKVYEFIQKKSLKNTIQNDIGVFKKYKNDIKEWFNQYLPSSKYIIHDDYTVEADNFFFNIFDYPNYNLSEFPFIKLKVDYGLINLSDNKTFLKLPKSIIFKTGSIILNNTNITKLPEKLIIINDGNLSIENTRIKKLSENIKIAYAFYAENSDITNFPKSLINDNKFNGTIDLENTNITELPEELEFCGSNLILRNTKIKKLPSNLKKVYGNLYINNTLITELPDNLIITESLDIRNTLITELPKNLTARHLIIENYNRLKTINYNKDNFIKIIYK